jgi:hypothetical protein
MKLLSLLLEREFSFFSQKDETLGIVDFLNPDWILKAYDAEPIIHQ